ncbi:sigma-54-dependent Fis family transcriptional regulator [Ectothiorhodospiraceae bacterium 2226]|nr:sigma-54-dependent Fis family transcriptional regulator [Ectothiorhodospiraceae bacterium 2226]
MSKPRILIVDDEQIALRNLTHVMQKEGYEVVALDDGERALAALDEQRFEVVLTDLRMKPVDGIAVLRHCRELHPHTEVILITGYATLKSAVDAMREGAFYYVAKPFRLDEVRQIVHEAVEKVRLRAENDRLRQLLDAEEGTVRIVGNHARMRELLTTARQVAGVDCSVLITGESGTGKELVARYLHAHGRRAQGPFVAANCGAFSEDLLANELFGHAKGAFTGAGNDKEGLIEAANGGTVFLDEVTEMSPAMQVKLLRVIQEREVLPLGATRAVPVDVRFLAATNRDPEEAVAAGVLRKDLYYRLNVVGLHIPPLRERREDIPLLIAHLMQKHAALLRRPAERVTEEAMARLLQHDFPGNVRELENIVVRGIALAPDGVIEARHLPPELHAGAGEALQGADAAGDVSLEAQEAAHIRRVLAQTGGNKTQAAQLLGIDRVSLWRKLKRLGMR